MSSAGVVTHCLSVLLLLIVCQMRGNAQDSTLWQLSSEELKAYDNLMDSGGEVVFIAPRPGTLRIIPDGLSKAGSQTPSTAYLRVVRAGGTDTTSVVRYFTCSGSYNQSVFNTCDSTQFSVPIYWHEQFFPPSCPVYRPRDCTSALLQRVIHFGSPIMQNWTTQQCKSTWLPSLCGPSQCGRRWQISACNLATPWRAAFC